MFFIPLRVILLPSHREGVAAMPDLLTHPNEVTRIDVQAEVVEELCKLQAAVSIDVTLRPQPATKQTNK